MHGSFTSGIILNSYHETKRNFKNVRSDWTCGGRDTGRVAITVDRIDVPDIAIEAERKGSTYWAKTELIKQSQLRLDEGDRACS